MYNYRPMRTPGLLCRLRVDGMRKTVSLPVSLRDDRFLHRPVQVTEISSCVWSCFTRRAVVALSAVNQKSDEADMMILQ